VLSNVGGTLPSMYIAHNVHERPRATANSVTSIDVLDDDPLINIFRLYRPDLLDEEETNDIRILQGGEWCRESWWYKLVHVCRRWRSLIFASASHLGLSLLCTYRTPVADMLAHSPPLPLVIDYADWSQNLTLSPVDKEGIKLALRHRNRVRRIRLAIVIETCATLIDPIDKEFPILEDLYIDPFVYCNGCLKLPETFRAPNLRHLFLSNFALPVGSSLLATATGLVTFWLKYIPTSWHPADFLHHVSSMHHLQTLGISAPSNDYDGRRVVNTPDVTHVVLPNLRWLEFQGGPGGSTYIEALLPHMSTPRLEKLTISFLNERTASIPNLRQFISSAENLRFTSASLRSDRTRFDLKAYPCNGSGMYALSIVAYCHCYDWPLSSTMKMLGILGPHLSMVMLLSVESCSGYARAEYRDILRSFNNVKTLRVNGGLIRDISHALKVCDGESTMGLLPELKEVICSASVDEDDLFDSFSALIDAREHAGHPVTLITR